MKACLNNFDSGLYVGWIPTLLEEANFETAFKDYLRDRISSEKCHIFFKIKIRHKESDFSSNSRKFEWCISQFDICPIFGVPAFSLTWNVNDNYCDIIIDPLFIGDLSKNCLYMYKLIKGTLDKIGIQNLEINKEYEILVYPKITTDKLIKLKRIYADSVIIIVGKRTPETDLSKRLYLRIEKVIILDVPFKTYFSFCLQSKCDEIPFYGIGNVLDMDTNGLILYQAILNKEIISKAFSKVYTNEFTFTKNVDIDIFYKVYKKARYEALGKQIYAILSDIYLLNLFHGTSTDIVHEIITIPSGNNINGHKCLCEDKSFTSNYAQSIVDSCDKIDEISFEKCEYIRDYAIERLRYKYSQKVSIITDNITQYCQDYFYQYFSYGRIRDVQELLRRGNGEMLYGKHFVEIFFGGSEYKHSEKLIEQFNTALQSIKINTERLENKWTFTMFFPLLSIISCGIYSLYEMDDNHTNFLIKIDQFNSYGLLPTYQPFIDLKLICIVLIISTLIPVFFIIGSFIILFIGDLIKKSVKWIRRRFSIMSIKHSKKIYLD